MFNAVVSQPDASVYQDNETVAGVIIHVADNPQFTNPLVLGGNTSLEYEFHLNERYMPGTTLYARARYVFSVGGLQGWSETFTVTVNDRQSITVDMHTPIVTEAPNVAPMLARDLMPVVGLGFTVTEPSFSHRVKYLRYVVTDDSRGKTTTMDTGTTNDYTILLNNRLYPNRNYTIRVCYEFDNGAVSMFGGFSFITGSDRSIIYFGRGGNVFTSGELTSFVVGGTANSLIIEMIKDGIITHTSTGNIGVINTNGNVPNPPYTVSVTPVTALGNGVPIYQTIEPETASSTLPATIPYTLV